MVQQTVISIDIRVVLTGVVANTTIVANTARPTIKILELDSYLLHPKRGHH